MKTHRENPDSEECQRMTRENERAVQMAQIDLDAIYKRLCAEGGKVVESPKFTEAQLNEMREQLPPGTIISSEGMIVVPDQSDEEQEEAE